MEMGWFLVTFFFCRSYFTITYLFSLPYPTLIYKIQAIFFLMLYIIFNIPACLLNGLCSCSSAFLLIVKLEMFAIVGYEVVLSWKENMSDVVALNYFSIWLACCILLLFEKF
ncbi:hypothetical protein KFK09_022586 [Dendrobium nobile]|uniref:Uncharacterized protein n=1 Tax=Dendrobium nobile TaxID=94219 RepID=A0A8T3AKD9_DENNO|nr:hypothetical protein KFK09_022586 [Dendrobium nobile]